ncbi:hypothetical protein P9272_35685 [Mesorhizobium sp. WSM4976]|uniref:hypothetical protein n=1 Tax=Mesorhizobium sp. WSM4976 TaxID=3038549 RepID=UPI002417958F|nr:hypothetical protein [Mesorhizobium sp. WSM4976]MDG4898828.1 hypothetical protein [Mesorhizobium sp. WSM4976]
MKTAIVCVAFVLAASSAAVAHEKKKTVTSQNTCAGLSIKQKAAAKLDCTATGTANPPATDAATSKPRLGYETSRPEVLSFGL